MRLKLAVLAALAAVSLFGQTTAPTDMVGIRAGYDAAATPTTSGGFVYAHKLTDNAHPTYSYSMINFAPQKTQPYVHMTTTETGIAQHVATVGPFSVYALGTAGGAFAGDNVGFSLGGGGMAIAGFGHGIYGGPYARASKATISSGQYEFGVALFVSFSH